MPFVPALLPADDSRFPTSLLAISDCPSELWYCGRLEVFDAPAVAIVGSRAASAVNPSTVSGLAKDGTRKTLSPAIARRSRLVARMET